MTNNLETHTDLAAAVLSQLETGRSKALKGEIIAQRLGLRGTRHIREAILELIEKGYRVVSTSTKPYGYYLAENEEDIKQNIKTLDSYIEKLAKHRRDLIRASQGLLKPEQMRLKL